MSGDPSGFSLPPGTLEPLKIDPASIKLAQSAGASVGKKYLMAIAGLVWCLFVLAHLLGNLTIFIGPTVFNDYSDHLISMGVILNVLEAGLVFFLLLHVLLSLVVTVQNWSARPVKYHLDKAKGGRTVASSTMIYTGILILLFVVVHLVNLKFAEHHELPEGKIDIYRSTVLLFQEPLYVLGYVVAVCLVGLHASHALQSGLRTLGWNSERSYPKVDRLSRLFGWFLALGFASIPVWAFLSKGGAL